MIRCIPAFEIITITHHLHYYHHSYWKSIPCCVLFWELYMHNFIQYSQEIEKLDLWCVEWWSPKRYVHVLIPGAHECDLIWNKKKGLYRCIWVKDLELRISSGLLRWTINPMKNVLIRDTQREDMEEEKAQGIGGRDCSDVATGQGTSCATRSQGSKEQIIATSLWRGHSPIDNLISDIRPSDWERIHESLLF